MSSFVCNTKTQWCSNRSCICTCSCLGESLPVNVFSSTHKILLNGKITKRSGNPVLNLRCSLIDMIFNLLHSLVKNFSKSRSRTLVTTCMGRRCFFCSYSSYISMKDLQHVSYLFQALVFYSLIQAAIHVNRFV